ncbi:hypothetical protein KIPB_014135, partial [Kipferlia bialata]|eukprot:g14135.t1
MVPRSKRVGKPTVISVPLNGDRGKLPLRLFNDPEMYLWAQVVRDTSCPLPNQAQVREAVIEEGDKAVVAAISQ